MTVPVETQHTVDELLDLVFQDELTGLFNRRYLNNRIGRDLENTTVRRPLTIGTRLRKFLSVGHAAADRSACC